MSVDGKPLAAPEAARLWRYYKPLGLVTSERDEKGRDTVFAHLPAEVRDPMLELTDVWSGNAEEAADLLAALGRPLADDAEVCACAGVSAGEVRACATVPECVDRTRVTTGCGGCADLVRRLVEEPTGDRAAAARRQEAAAMESQRPGQLIGCTDRA